MLAHACRYANLCATNAEGQWTGAQAFGPKSANYQCMGSQMRSATTWLGIVTGGLMVSGKG